MIFLSYKSHILFIAYSYKSAQQEKVNVVRNTNQIQNCRIEKTEVKDGCRWRWVPLPLSEGRDSGALGFLKVCKLTLSSTIFNYFEGKHEILYFLTIATLLYGPKNLKQLTRVQKMHSYHVLSQLKAAQPHAEYAIDNYVLSLSPK